MFLFLFCLGITGSLAEIPLFGPVERRTCIRERYYFATNALYRNFEKAKRNCDYYRCDIIVKYEAGMEYQDRIQTTSLLTSRFSRINLGGYLRSRVQNYIKDEKTYVKLKSKSLLYEPYEQKVETYEIPKLYLTKRLGKYSIYNSVTSNTNT